MIAKIKKSLNNINKKLLIVLILTGLVPTIYTTVRVFLIGQLPGDWGFNIASQLAWVNVIVEVLQEALILPLFCFFGATMLSKSELANRIKTGLIFTFIIFLVFAGVMIIFTKPILEIMAQDATVINETVKYIRLESIAIIFSIMYKFLTVVLISQDKQKILYINLFIQMVLSIILDVFLVSNLSISLKLGVNGIAVTNIVVNLLLVVGTLVIINRNIQRLEVKEKLDFSWIKKLLKVGSISGLESLVRNFFFLVMIIRMVNVVGEQGNYWVTNNFIWLWLLVPIIQMGELIKKEIADDKENVKKNILGYTTLTTLFILIWFVTMPLWNPFFKNILLISNYTEIVSLSLLMIGFYIFFAYNNILDSIFYGLGKTGYMLFQSLVINLVYYGFMFILFLTDLYEPSLKSIAIMFGVGLVLDSILTFFAFKHMKKRNFNLVAYE